MSSGDTPPRGIRVICRFRPQNKIEDSKGGTCCVTFKSSTTLCVKDHDFAFDRVFDGSATQKDIYKEVQPAVQDLLEGFNATIFAYGQTSSGKTHTMQGPDIDDPELRGVVPRVIDDIFDRIAQAPENLEFTIRASYLEIYLEKIRDLLDPARDNLQVREDRTKGIYVQGQKEVFVCNKEEVYEVLHVGQYNRAVSATGMNNQSSRSHSVFLLAVTCKNTKDNSTRSGKLYLVDLAGSEKVGKTGASGTTLEEAKMINKSLSALGNVIKALTEGKKGGKEQYVPYRDSKLTRLLQESLGGNARTTLIINCSPSSYNEDETLSTLRFGTRAKTIINKATANVERSAAELKAMLAKAEAEIARLKGIISAVNAGNPSAAAAADAEEKNAAASAKMLEMANKLEEFEKQIEEMNDQKTQAIDAKEALRDLLEQKTIELEKSVAKCTETEKEKLRLEEELENVQSQYSEAQRELTETKLSMEELVVRVERYKSECQATNDAFVELQQKHEQLLMERMNEMMDSQDSSLNVTPSSTPNKLDDKRSVSPAVALSASARTFLDSTNARFDATSEELRENLQRGLARFREIENDLFGSDQQVPDEKLLGAIDEINLLAGSLSPCRTPAVVSPLVTRLPDAEDGVIDGETIVKEELDENVIAPQPLDAEVQQEEPGEKKGDDQIPSSESAEDEKKEENSEEEKTEEEKLTEDVKKEENVKEEEQKTEEIEEEEKKDEVLKPEEEKKEGATELEEEKKEEEDVKPVQEEKKEEDDVKHVEEEKNGEEDVKLEEEKKDDEKKGEEEEQKDEKKDEEEEKKEETKVEENQEKVEDEKKDEAAVGQAKVPKIGVIEKTPIITKDDSAITMIEVSDDNHPLGDLLAKQKEEEEAEKKEKSSVAALELVSKSYAVVPPPEVAQDADASTVRSAYSAQLELANKEIAIAESTRARLKLEIESMNQVKERMRVEIDAYKREAEEKLKSLAKIRQELQSDIENRCLRVVEVQQQLDDMEEKYNSARKDRQLVDVRREKRQALNHMRELQKATRVVHTVEKERDKLRKDVDELQKLLAAHKQYERKQEEQMQELQKKLREMPRARQTTERPTPVAFGYQAYQIQQQQKQQQQQQGVTRRGKMVLSSNFSDSKVSRSITGGGGGGGAPENNNS